MKRRANDSPETEDHKKRDYTGDIIKLITAVIIAFSSGTFAGKALNGNKSGSMVSAAEVISKEEALNIKQRVHDVESSMINHLEIEKKDREWIEQKFDNMQVKLDALNEKLNILIKLRRSQ